MNPSTNRNWSTVPLLLLLAADLIFVGLQILHALGFAGDPRFSLGAERGYAEIYQYVKLFWTASLLSWFALEMREGLYGVGSLLFGYLLLDDALEIHESAGRAIVDVLGIPSALGLRGQDYGEVGVSALAGLVFLGMGWWAYRHSSPRARCMGVFVFVGVLALAGVGVGGDVLHQFAGGAVGLDGAAAGDTGRWRGAGRRERDLLGRLFGGDSRAVVPSDIPADGKVMTDCRRRRQGSPTRGFRSMAGRPARGTGPAVDPLDIVAPRILDLTRHLLWAAPFASARPLD